MEFALTLLKTIGSLYISLLAGFLLVKLKAVDVKHSRVLSSLLLYALVPCSVIKAFQVEMTPQTLSNIGLAFLAAVIVQFGLFFLGMPMKKLFRLDPVEHTSVIYSNAGNMVIPLVSAVLGEEWVVYTVAYISVQLVFLWTHCRQCLSGEKGFQWKKVLLNPAIIAICVGLVLFFTGWRLPQVAADGVNMLSAMIGPVSMLVVGMLLGGMDWKKLFSRPRVWLVAVLRLAVTPLIIVFFLRFSGLSNLVADGKSVLYITLLSTSSPAASTVTNMSQLYDKDADYAGIINIVTTLLCVVSMPLTTLLYMSL